MINIGQEGVMMNNILAQALKEQGKFLLNIGPIYYVIDECWNTLMVGTLEEINAKYMKV